MADVTPWRAVLDGNAVDYFMAVPNAFEFLQEARDSGRIDLMFTHDVVEEILDTGDPERRTALLLHLLSFARMVPSGAFVLGLSRLNMARLAEEDSDWFEDARAFDDGTGKPNNTRDAIVIATARFERCPAVSNDLGLRNRANRNGVEAITPDDALRRMGFS